MEDIGFFLGDLLFIIISIFDSPKNKIRRKE